MVKVASSRLPVPRFVGRFFYCLLVNSHSKYLYLQFAGNSIYSRPSDKNVPRFHYQDAIYLPRLQSLAMVLGVFKVIIKYQKREKGGNGKGRKKHVLPPHHPLLSLVPIILH